MMEILAQTALADKWPDLAVQGGIGAIAVFMLRWFMLRSEVRMRAIEVSNDRMARSNLLLVIALRQANEAVKIEARSMLKDLDDSQTHGEK